MSYEVHIIRDSDGEVVERMTAATERQAQRIARGAGINLNWNEYHVKVVEQTGGTEK